MSSVLFGGALTRLLKLTPTVAKMQTVGVQALTCTFCQVCLAFFGAQAVTVRVAEHSFPIVG